MSGNPFCYPWSTLPGTPWPSMLPVMPLGGQVLLPLATFDDTQVFWAGADFGRLLQAANVTISDTFSISAYVIQGTDPDANMHWVGEAAVVNGLAPPYGTGWPLSGVRRQWGPGIANVTYGFVASATLSDGTVVTQGSQGSCIATEVV
jgi:hypothetical protein